MFTPGTSRHRRNLRQVLNDVFPKTDPEIIFERVKKPRAEFVEINDLEPYCEKANCPAAVLENLFGPYGVKNLLINRSQWINFMKDDFPLYIEKEDLAAEPLNQRQNFILKKFVEGLLTKFGSKMSDKWNAAILRNPPGALNDTLKTTALCKLYENMNLPFSTAEFIDALFLFYGERIDGITRPQFQDLFTSFSLQ